MKVTHDLPLEKFGEAGLIVEGHFMPWTQIKKNFECVYSPLYHEKFIVHKQTREVYTYLDNHKGLQNHHPFLTEMNPISVLDQNDYQKVWQKAKTFVRDDERNLLKAELEQKNEDSNTQLLKQVTI